MLALIVSGLAFMEGKGWDGIVVDMGHEYVPALLNNCAYVGVGDEMSHFFDALCFYAAIHNGMARCIRFSDTSYLFYSFSWVGTLWVPATVINIAFVQPALRVLYDNLVFFFWTIYLSMVLNK